MNEIICPHCQRAFKIDEAGYADILKQVRNHEFEEELKKQESFLTKEKEDAVSLAEERIKNTFQKTLSEKDQAIQTLEADKQRELLAIQTKKDIELAELKAKLQAFETEKALAVAEALSNVQRERDQLESSLINERNLKESEIKALEASLKMQLTEAINVKDAEIKSKEQLIEQYKDMKIRLSTKMLGETLEKHCEVQFNQVRSMAFPTAYFEKDNDLSAGSKGDYIYRENDADGNEIISIMFEMKNESDETNAKKKNEDFFKKLDEDRDKKKCEYAILVSMLEADNELYNGGIVDVSYRYPKMYVIRPQFFIPIITLLRNAALNSLKYKAELNKIKNQHIDITNFENKINEFKSGFDFNRKQAASKFETAVKEIDNSIKHLTLVRDNLLGSINQMRLASDKLDDLTIKKLTRGNPTMTDNFKELGGD
jgi:hypothetical protein